MIFGFKIIDDDGQCMIELIYINNHQLNSLSILKGPIRLCILFKIQHKFIIKTGGNSGRKNDIGLERIEV